MANEIQTTEILLHGSSTSQPGEVEHIRVSDLNGLLRHKADKRERFVGLATNVQLPGPTQRSSITHFV